MNHHRIALTASLLVGGLGGRPALAQDARPEARRVVAGEAFGKGGSWQFWFGRGYRRAWTTPAELPVLDLKAEAGGLTPLRQVGGLQTVGLAMKGADGRSFTFRKLEKETERVLPAPWRGTAVADIVRDQTSAAHPAATVITGALARSVGIMFYESRLVVMPDDPALGEFRKTFGNAAGTFDEYITPGYQGITEILSSTKLWWKWSEGGPENRVDQRAFLKARLFDLMVGNWDRHQGQWRWARFPGKPLWEPLPEDADQAFSRYEGVILGAARGFKPSFMVYSGRYPKKMEGFTANSFDVTRWLLTDLEWPVYQDVARELKEQLTDQAIDAALRRMPSAWYAIDGEPLAKDLRQRRDGLLEFARKFYLHLADRVDIRATDRDDLAAIQHFEDGSLKVTLSPAAAAGTASTPYYERRFSPKETQEVNVYLLGGNDRLLTAGPKTGRITLRVLGGRGDDALDDSESGGADIRDSEGKNLFTRGPGTGVSERPWTNPNPNPNTPWLEPRGYGHWTVPTVQAWWEPTKQLMVGGGFTRTAWGFRKYPWANMQSATLLFSTGYKKFKGNYAGQWRLTDSNVLGRIDLLVSGIENTRFYGLGNETENLDDGLSKTQEYTLAAFPSLRIQPGPNFEFNVGVQIKALKPTPGSDALVDQRKPYGSGEFAEVGARTGFEFDSRGRTAGFAPGALVEPGFAAEPKVSGVRILANSFYVPKAFDVTADFGGVDGTVSGYLGNPRLSLAARAGGRKLWGPYPWFESATIGGSDDLRGYDSNRYRGDASLFGNAELRYWLGNRKKPTLPMRWGLFGFAESGRVWLKGETSEKWHTGFGGGLMAQFLGTPLTLAGSMASGSEGLHFYFKGGYSF